MSNRMRAARAARQAFTREVKKAITRAATCVKYLAIAQWTFS